MHPHALASSLPVPVPMPLPDLSSGMGTGTRNSSDGCGAGMDNSGCSAFRNGIAPATVVREEVLIGLRKVGKGRIVKRIGLDRWNGDHPTDDRSSQQRQDLLNKGL